MASRVGRKISFLVLLACGFLSGCTAVYTAHGAHYRVRKGDTLEGIAGRFHTSPQEVAEVNNIERPEDLKVGRSIYFPRAKAPRFAAIIRHETARSRRVARRSGGKERKVGREKVSIGQEAVAVDHGRFLWPVDGEISSLYGIRRGRRHDGLDIRAREGTPVKAAAGGEVVYSKRMRGYGNLVLVKHEEDFFTVYAHNSVNLVKAGKKVRKGDILSKVGRTGRATGPHLHFEVREGTKARNPLFFLPKTQYAQKAREKGIDHGGPEREDEGESETENP